MTPIQSGPECLRRQAVLLDATKPEPFSGPHPRATTMERYANDPAFAAEIDAETAANRARANAAIDAGMRKFWESRK